MGGSFFIYPQEWPSRKAASNPRQTSWNNKNPYCKNQHVHLLRMTNYRICNGDITKHYGDQPQKDLKCLPTYTRLVQ